MKKPLALILVFLVLSAICPAIAATAESVPHEGMTVDTFQKNLQECLEFLLDAPPKRDLVLK